MRNYQSTTQVEDEGGTCTLAKALHLHVLDQYQSHEAANPISYARPLRQVHDVSSALQHSEHDAHYGCCVNWMVWVITPSFLVHFHEMMGGSQPYGLTCNVCLDSQATQLEASEMWLLLQSHSLYC